MKTKAETKKTAAIANGEQEDGSIDKIRDILFGVQMRESDRKMTKIEETLFKEIESLRDEMIKRSEALESFMKEEFKSLSERLSSEQMSREDSAKDLSEEIKFLTHNVEKKVSQINEHAAKSESGLREQLLAQSKNMMDDSQKRYAELTSKLEKESSEIRSDKADRAHIAQLFTEMALRLTDDFKLPEE